MKELINKVKQNKLLFILLLIMILFTILGILFPALINSENKVLIKNSIENFMTSIDKNNINYISAFISSITNNIIGTILIWILGISIIGIPIILISIAFKSFLTGFSITSIFITYGIKGTLIAIVYTLPNMPNIINLLGSFLLGYYAISFSIMIYKSVFKKETRNWQPIVKRYLKIGIFFIIFSIIVSIIESYLIPKILLFI